MTTRRPRWRRGGRRGAPPPAPRAEDRDELVGRRERAAADGAVAVAPSSIAGGGGGEAADTAETAESAESSVAARPRKGRRAVEAGDAPDEPSWVPMMTPRRTRSGGDSARGDDDDEGAGARAGDAPAEAKERRADDELSVHLLSSVACTRALSMPSALYAIV